MFVSMNPARFTIRLPLSLIMGLLASCTAPRASHEPSKPPLSAPAATRVTNASKQFTSRHPGQTGARLLPRGREALDARLALADAAGRSLDVQYYIWNGDTSGAKMVLKLLQAADRGVRVRVLLDDIGVIAADESLHALDEHPNVEVRLFNPVALRSAQMLGVLANFTRANRRMHNKAFIADNEAVIVGGRNIGDEYFDADESVNFADLDVLAVGAVVPGVAAQFEQYWDSPYAVGISHLSRAKKPGSSSTARQQLEARLAQPLRKAPAQRDLFDGKNSLSPCKAWALYDDPDKVAASPDDRSTHLAPMLWSTVEGTSEHLFIVSPYFIPGKDGLKMLERVRKRGVRVTILTNALASTDVPAVHAGYKRYRKPLLRAGIDLYELKPKTDNATAGQKRYLFGSSSASLHAKTFAFDDETLFIGSMNLDPRSIKLNTEIGILLSSPKLTADVTQPILRNINKYAYRLRLNGDKLVWIANESGNEVRYDKEPLTSNWQRIRVNLLGILPIEGQL